MNENTAEDLQYLELFDAYYEFPPKNNSNGHYIIKFENL